MMQLRQAHMATAKPIPGASLCESVLQTSVLVGNKHTDRKETALCRPPILMLSFKMFAAT